MPSAGELLITATAVAAVAGYVVRTGIELASRAEPMSPAVAGRDLWARRAWTFGAVFLVVHMLVALAFEHGWSHAAAYEHTAERTAAAVGWRWGGGLYLNDGLTAWWVVDAVLWWTRGPDFPRRHPRYTRWLHVASAFMVFNATVVFGPWYWVPVAGLTVAVLLLLAGRSGSGSPAVADPEPGEGAGERG